MDQPFNECEVGLFDDWEPAIWSELVPRRSSELEDQDGEDEIITTHTETVTETRTVPKEEESTQKEEVIVKEVKEEDKTEFIIESKVPHISKGVFSADKGVLSDEEFECIQNGPKICLQKVYEHNSTGNKVTRGNAIPNRPHDKFVERMSDSMDELQDVGLMNSGGYGGNNNHLNGLGAPPLTSNLHWEYKNWVPGMPLPEPGNNSKSGKGERINGENNKKDNKKSMFDDFEIANLP